MRTWADLDEFQAFLDDGGMVEADDDMPEEYRHGLPIYRVPRQF